MRPQAVVVGARQTGASRSRAPRQALPDEAAPYRLTRRVHRGEVFDLFRAATKGEMGPGCYVVKRPRGGSRREIAAAMLGREAIVAAAVQHPNLTCVLAAETSAEKPQLLFLPFRDGVSLRQVLDLADSSISVSRALSIGRQVAEALAALHAAGWLHGQVRPEHVLLSPQGQATVIDLTRARRLGTAECDPGGMATREAAYAAPETAVGKRRLTWAADVYSLGVVLFEVLAGRPPFEGSSAHELMEKHWCQAVPDIRAARPGVTLEFAHLLRLMLTKEALRRPTDGELVRWLAELEIAALAL